jgi:integrase
MKQTIIPLIGPGYETFANTLDNENTKAEYTRLLLYFATWKKVKRLDDLLKSDPKDIKKDIIKYLLYLRDEKGLRSSSRSGACAALKHFYSMNEVELSWDYINKFVGKDKTIKEDREYTHDEIAKILDVSDMKYKAMILLMASSGIRIGAIPDLKYGDLTKVPKHNIFKIIIYRFTNDEYYSFTTPEAYKAITEYLDFRQRSGEVLNLKSPLFRLDFDPRDINQVNDSTPLSYNAIKSRLRHLLIRSGIRVFESLSKEDTAGKYRYSVKAAHGLRKFCITQMGKSRMDPEIREMLVGHKLGVRAVYLKYPEEDRLNEYLRAVDNLTINAENRLKKELDEYKKQEREIQELKQEKDKQSAQIEELLTNQESETRKLNELVDQLNRQAEGMERNNDLVVWAETKRSNKEIERSESLIKKMEQLPQENWVRDLIERERELLKVSRRRVSDITAIKTDSDRKKVDGLVKGTAKNIMKSSKKK